MNRKIILIAGSCATGKSTFSYLLSKALNVPCFNKDKLKETIGDSLVEVPPEIFSKLSNTAFCLMKYISECFLKLQLPVILESNFRQAELDEIAKMAQLYQYDCLIYVFSGNIQKVFERYMSREKTDRHWIHISPITETIDTFSTNAKMFTSVKINKATVVNVDATNFNEINYDDLVQKAKAFLVESNCEL